jgi:hypothetical protein
VVGSLAFGGSLGLGCGGSDPELATNGGGGIDGSKAYSVGLGGDAGAAGESGQAGAGAASGQGDGGQAGETGGFAGQGASAGSATGGKGGASPCTDALEPLAACTDDAKGPCAACVCASEACAQHWADCAASDGCARAVSCLTHGCSADLCAEQAGKGQMKLVALLACLGGDCGGVCGQTGAGGAGGSGAAGGASGSGAGGGSGKSGAAGKAGVSGQGGSAGSGQGGATPAGSGGTGTPGGAAGTGGLSEQGGAAGSGGVSAAGTGGENSGGQAGGVPLACKVPTASPSLGTCTEKMGNSTCNPITGAPCKVDAGEVCGGIWADGVLAGFGCEMPVTLGGVCDSCGAGVACEAGLLCSVGAGQCGKLCCDSGDCGQGNHCSVLSGSEGVGLCLTGAP